MCDNQEIVLANVRNVKITSPDYKNWEPEQAVQDYMARIRDHERFYQPVDEPDWPWIKIINVSEEHGWDVLASADPLYLSGWRENNGQRV